MGKRVTVYFTGDEFTALTNKAARVNVRVGPFCRRLLQGEAAVPPQRNVELCTALSRNRANLAQVQDHLQAATASPLTEPLPELLEEAQTVLRDVRYALMGIEHREGT